MIHDCLNSKAVFGNVISYRKDVFRHDIQAFHIEFAAHFLKRSLETLLAGLVRERCRAFIAANSSLIGLEKLVLKAELPLDIAHVANLSLRIPPLS